jgi:hypothetical protein
MLRGAGVPFTDSDSIAVVRSKLAAATWAAEQLRKLSDACSLPGSIPQQRMQALGIAEGWTATAQDLALGSILSGCRESPWALDQASTRGIVSVHRSAIFRAAEAVTAPAGAPGAMHVSQHLSADEADSHPL